MVRKKGVHNTKRKKSKATKDTLARIKSFFYGACFVVVVIAGTLFSYEKLSPYFKMFASEVIRLEKTGVMFPEKESAPVKKKNDAAETQNIQPEKKTLEKVKLPAKAELPVCVVKKTEQVIRHKGYTVSYNSDYRIANWVAYELTREEVQITKIERKNKFVIDPDVKGASAFNEDYTGTGYDRGHLAPAGDMKWSLQAMQESFYLSNITPQKPKLNRGIWKDLEEQCRMWAVDNGALLIATGPVIKPGLKRMGKNRVAIPEQFYKVICTIKDNQYEAVGFLLDNRDYGSKQLKDLMIPVDSVEAATGIDFFPALPDKIEKKVEAKVNKNAWSF